MKAPVGEDSGVSALIKAGAPAHPGSHCINIPHPVHLQEPPHTCHLTVLLIKQKLFLLLNHSPRAHIFLICCVANGKLAQCAATTHSSMAVGGKKSIHLTFLELQREPAAFVVEHYFFSCKKHKKIKNPADYGYSNYLVSRNFPVNE